LISVRHDARFSVRRSEARGVDRSPRFPSPVQWFKLVPYILKQVLCGGGGGPSSAPAPGFFFFASLDGGNGPFPMFSGKRVEGAACGGCVRAPGPNDKPRPFVIAPPAAPRRSDPLPAAGNVGVWVRVSYPFPRRFRATSNRWIAGCVLPFIPASPGNFFVRLTTEAGSSKRPKIPAVQRGSGKCPERLPGFFFPRLAPAPGCSPTRSRTLAGRGLTEKCRKLCPVLDQGNWRPGHPWPPKGENSRGCQRFDDGSAAGPRGCLELGGAGRQRRVPRKYAPAPRHGSPASPTPPGRRAHSRHEKLGCFYAAEGNRRRP